MAKETKDSTNKTWIMTIGVVFNSEINKESAIQEFQRDLDECLDDYRMIEVLNAKEGSFTFKIVENEL